ncbi:MAG: sulfite exporter TauE/SafE family protein [Candidatus Sericytochromatia bacterium]|nr:sulfite exporter TauE/SafE family protein [Candidatus Sericytochromatia bacterium]
MILPDGLVILLGLGLGTGILSGLLGVGGGFLLVPALALLGWPMAKAVGTSLAYVAVVGAGGALVHFRNGNVTPTFVLWVAFPAAVLAPAGAALAAFMPNNFLALFFAFFLAAMALFMRKKKPDLQDGDHSTPPAKGRAVLLGAGVGLLSGLFGVGGGLLLVPAQVQWLDIPLKRAIGNSLGAVLLTGLSGTIAHIQLGTLEATGGSALILGGLAGVGIGSRLMQRIPTEGLRLYFWIFLLLLSVLTGIRSVLSLIH